MRVDFNVDVIEDVRVDVSVHVRITWTCAHVYVQ